MSSNRRDLPPTGVCCLCGLECYAPDVVLLFRTDGEGRTVWHGHCAQAAAIELSALAARAQTREVATAGGACSTGL